MDEGILEKIMGHGAWSVDPFDLKRDGVGLKDADPDGEQDCALQVLQNHDWRVRRRIHHETFDLEFLFHISLCPCGSDTNVCYLLSFETVWSRSRDEDPNQGSRLFTTRKVDDPVGCRPAEEISSISGYSFDQNRKNAA